MNVLTFLNSMRPSIPMSLENKKESKCWPASNSEIRRWLLNKAVIINGQHLAWDQEIEFPVTSLVFFPRSEKKRTTVI